MLMKLSSKAAILAVLICGGCVSTAELPERTEIQAPLPQGTQSAAIRALPMKPGTVKNVEGAIDAPHMLAGYVKEALALKRPGWQIRLADPGGAPISEDISITLELVQIEGGSAALRFWIGLNTGATQSIVNVSTADKTGKALASTKISESTVCPVGACVESNDEMVRRNLQSLAAEIAEFVLDPAQYEKDRQARTPAGE
jgi:hypothetical protein